MNTIFKIQQIWQYLGVQDDEILIIRHYNDSDKKDEFLIVESTPDGLNVTTTNSMPELGIGKSFQMIQQRDSSGRFIIPSVAQLIQDKVSDY
ncbi:MAG: hypothetical protein HDS02_03700 [Bacteroides sp.]|nr:hypothetical protein [Bacteroides sp.]